MLNLMTPDEVMEYITRLTEQRDQFRVSSAVAQSSIERHETQMAVEVERRHEEVQRRHEEVQRRQEEARRHEREMDAEAQRHENEMDAEVQRHEREMDAEVQRRQEEAQRHEKELALRDKQIAHLEARNNELFALVLASRSVSS